MEITRWNAAGKGPRSCRLTSRLIVYKTYQQTPSLLHSRFLFAGVIPAATVIAIRETSSFFFLLFLFLFQSHPDTTRRKLENIKCKVALDYAPHPSKRAFSRRVPFLLYILRNHLRQSVRARSYARYLRIPCGLSSSHTLL